MHFDFGNMGVAKAPTTITHQWFRWKSLRLGTIKMEANCALNADFPARNSLENDSLLFPENPNF